MIKNTFTLAFILLAIAFQWSCHQETLSEDDLPVSLRAPGGNGNGNGGNGNGNGNGGGPGGGGDTVYLYNATLTAQANGVALSTEPAGVRVEKDNGKYTSLTFDFEPEGCGPVVQTGINTLEDCFQATYSSVFFEIRQFNKKSNADRVAWHFWFTDPTLGDARFTMIGSITGVEDILLPGENDTVEITFDKYSIVPGIPSDIPPECIADGLPFEEEGEEIPGPILTLTRVADCP